MIGVVVLILEQSTWQWETTCYLPFILEWMVLPESRWFNPVIFWESKSSPFSALSLGILRLRSLTITVLCFRTCLCSGQFPFHCWVWSPAYLRDNCLIMPDPTEWLQLWRHCSPGEPATCFSLCNTQIFRFFSQLVCIANSSSWLPPHPECF